MYVKVDPNGKIIEGPVEFGIRLEKTEYQEGYRIRRLDPMHSGVPVIGVGMTLDTLAWQAVQRVLEVGRVKYPEDRWADEPSQYHINKALTHLRRKNRNLVDLEHALTRIAMALYIERLEGYNQP